MPYAADAAKATGSTAEAVKEGANRAVKYDMTSTASFTTSADGASSWMSF